jgi:YggT family protein
MPDISYVILNTLQYFFKVLEIILVLYIVVSWLPIKPNNPLVRFIRQASEPMLDPIRKLTKKSILGGRSSLVDFSPIIVFIILTFLQGLILGIMRGL